jgi:hypothetical protein
MWVLRFAGEARTLDVLASRCPHRRASHYRSGAKYCTTLIIAPANISGLNDLFACFIVPLIAVGRF